MLILSRKVNEEIIIDGNIRVKPVKLGRSRVRLGISAPQAVDIRRAELAVARSPIIQKAREPETAEAVTQ